MSPASKSKSKDKSAAKAAREQQKVSSKPSATAVNGGTGTATSAYNPVSGTFHALETTPSSTNITQTPQANGRFRNIIDESEEHLLDTAAEYDSVSNNDSCSGESEDHQKDKNNSSTSNNTSVRTDPIPGSDADKREKVRLKNEKKHQRQKERRAQELHERCCSYLTSRKLESLAQKLVAMGFTSEAATMALIQNEGRVDHSALWLLEGGEENKQHAASNLDGANIKIDISEELLRIVEFESSYKCSKQDVERVVVACEGDLDKTVETLKAQLKLQEAAVASQKMEEFCDQPTISSNGFHNNNTKLTGTSNIRTQSVKLVANTPPIQLHRRDDRDFNYTKPPSTISAQMEAAASKNLQYPSLRKVQSISTTATTTSSTTNNNSKPDWMKTAQNIAPSPSEKRWPASTSNGIPLQQIQAAAPQLKSDNRYMTNSEVKTMREPIYVMQRPQSSNGIRQNFPTPAVSLGASPPSSTNWYSNGGTNSLDIMKLANGGLGQQMQNLTLASNRSIINTQQLYPQDQFHHQQQFMPSPMEPNGGPGYYNNMHGTTTTRSSSLTVPSSLGLFTNLVSSGSSATSSQVDWSSRGNNISYCDYTSVDWSLDLTPLALPTSSIKGERLYDNSLHASYLTPSKAGFNRSVINGGESGGLMVDHHSVGPTAGAGSREWTSPFAGKDMFRVPRMFATSPSP